MPEFISEEEIERMKEFADIPRYKRTPEMLSPEAEGDRKRPDVVTE